MNIYSFLRQGLILPRLDSDQVIKVNLEILFFLPLPQIKALEVYATTHNLYNVGA